MHSQPFNGKIYLLNIVFSNGEKQLNEYPELGHTN